MRGWYTDAVSSQAPNSAALGGFGVGYGSQRANFNRMTFYGRKRGWSKRSSSDNGFSYLCHLNDHSPFLTGRRKIVEADAPIQPRGVFVYGVKNNEMAAYVVCHHHASLQNVSH